jgi:YVTN family beta-propeller protein
MRVQRLSLSAVIGILSLAIVGPVGEVGASQEKARLRAVKRDAFFTDLPAGNVYKAQIKFAKKPKVKVKKTFSRVGNPWGVAVDPNKKFILVTDNVTNELVKLDYKKGKEKARIGVGQGPTDVGINPSGDFAYVINNGDNTVTIVDTRTDQVAGTHKLGKGPLRIVVAANGAKAWVTNVDSDTISTIHLDASVRRQALRETTIETRPKTDCDVVGGIGTTFFNAAAPAFHFMNWACGSRALSEAIAPDDRGKGDQGDEGSSSESDEESRHTARRRGPVPTNRTDTGTPFFIPGAPTDMAAVGMTRSPTFLENGFCRSNVITAGFSPPDTPFDLSDDESWLWQFGGLATEFGAGTPFEPLIGGGGDKIWAHPICGPGCDPAKILAKVKQITVKGAIAIQDGSMIPVPFGPSC